MNNIKEVKREYNKESFQMEYTYSYEFKVTDLELGKGAIAKEYPEDYLEILTGIFRENLITYLASK